MNPISARMAYSQVAGASIVSGATAFESAAIAGKASSAIVTPYSGTAIGWVVSAPSEPLGEVVIEPATRYVVGRDAERLR
jgi:hypothetical protein